MLNEIYKSILETDRAPIFVCDVNDIILYMNRSAIARMSKRGGEALIGKSVLDCHNENSRSIIHQVVAWFRESPENNMVFTYHNDKENKDVYMVALRNECGELIGYYEKQEFRTPETARPYDFSHSLI